jgi:hypothetical protein
MSFIWRIKRILSNILKPWTKGQRALWFQHRQTKNQIKTLHHMMNELQLSIESVNGRLKESKRPKRGRPRKKSS